MLPLAFLSGLVGIAVGLAVGLAVGIVVAWRWLVMPAVISDVLQVSPAWLAGWK